MRWRRVSPGPVASDGSERVEAGAGWYRARGQDVRDAAGRVETRAGVAHPQRVGDHPTAGHRPDGRARECDKLKYWQARGKAVCKVELKYWDKNRTFLWKIRKKECGSKCGAEFLCSIG